jgi:hypothetical protein
MAACISCPSVVLNGASANSEGGRLSRMMKGHCYKNKSFPADTSFCKLNQPGGQIVITPPESVRVNTNLNTTTRLTQAYVKSLLAAKAIRTVNYTTESARILALESSAAECAPSNPFSSRIDAINTNCLTIPPPPGPPARCALTKNQKY